MCATGVNSPLTTSAGRLFDAVAAIGIRARVTYEGQAAAELEGLADTAERGAYPMPLVDARDGAEAGAATIIDPRETVRALAADVAAGANAAIAGARFHNALAGATAEACVREAERRGLTAAVLSGACSRTDCWSSARPSVCGAAASRSIVPARLPPNDGGIAYGQAAIAAVGRS